MEIKNYFGYMVINGENTIALFESEDRNNGELLFIADCFETDAEVTCTDLNKLEEGDVIENSNGERILVYHIDYVL